MQQGTCHWLRFFLLPWRDVPTLDVLTAHAGIQ
jgi:hypothetical protein